MQILKSATLTGKYDWVWPGDPCFDKERLDEDELAAAMESNDMDRVKAMCRDGEEPTVWELQHLHGQARRYVVDLALDDRGGERVSLQTLRKVAALGLVGARNLVGPSGPYTVTQDYVDPRSGLRCVSPTMMDDLDTIEDGAAVTAIGAKVIDSLSPSGN